MKILRALAVGALLSIVVSMYSAFAGLKIGGVYWPCVTGTIFAMAILKALGGTSKSEINIAQTAASAGGLLAAGLIFTIPAIWLLGLQVGLWEIFFISIVGGLAGVIFSVPLRKEMVEREKLPYPDGTAVAAIIEAGDEKGEKAKLVFGLFGVGAVFSLLRDYFAVLPGLLSIDALKNGISRLFSLGTSVSLIPFAGGYLIGLRFTAIWFAGAVLSNFILIPYLVSNNLFASKGEAAGGIAAPLGIGIVIGAAVAYFAIKALPKMKTIASAYSEAGKKGARLYGLSLIFLVALLTAVMQLNVVISVIAIAGAFAMAYVGARVTGEMNVDPMELFAMIVLIIAKLLFGFGAVQLVLLAAVVCISAGIAGDFLQDLKAGYLLKTNPRDQMVAQIVGVLAAAAVLGFVLFALNSSYTIGGPDLPAPQAVALSAIVGAKTLSDMLALGIVIGIIGVAALSFLPKILPSANISPIAVVAFGIGVYVPIFLSFPLFIGGLLRFAADKKGFTEKGRLLAAGAIAGEGFVGVALALIGFAATFL
ncbi:MAG: OPT/YSL family transporter [Candidatus Diapherotrites archaeon]|nr:OPT/YSL family transporter [Candidatus Diapherotrites archaeon]